MICFYFVLEIFKEGHSTRVSVCFFLEFIFSELILKGECSISQTTMVSLLRSRIHHAT
jgi:hypothetical protein